MPGGVLEMQDDRLLKQNWAREESSSNLVWVAAKETTAILRNYEQTLRKLPIQVLGCEACCYKQELISSTTP